MKNLILFTLLSISLISNSNNVFAQAVWYGTVDSDWTDPANWAGGVPTAGESILIDGDDASYVNDPIITVDFAPLVGALTVQDGATLTIQADLTGNASSTGADGSATDILISNGGTITHSAGIVSDFDDVDINGGTLNISGTAQLIAYDDIKFSGDNGAVNVSGGTLTAGDGASGSGQLNFNGNGDNVINVTGGTMNIDEVENPGTGSTVENSGGTVNIANNTVPAGPPYSISSQYYVTSDLTLSGDVDITAAGELIVMSGIELEMEGDITNAGSIVGLDGSVVRFIKSGSTQDLTSSGTIVLDNIGIGQGSPLISTALDLNGNISVHGDWANSSGSSFTPNTNTVTMNGSSAQLILSSLDFYILAIDNVNGVTFGGTTTCTISNQLTLTSGVLTMSSGSIIMADDAICSPTIGSATSFVDGAMTKIGNDIFFFPVGDDDIWAPIGMGAPASTDSEMTAQYSSAAYANSTIDAGSSMTNISAVEYWLLDHTGGTAPGSIAVELTWQDGAYSGIQTLADLRIAHFDGSDWAEIGSATTGDANSGTISGTTASFSPFTFGTINSSNNSLPVTWLNFEGKIKEDQVELIWSTASETDNAGFIIEKSIDGKLWSEIGFVEGAGTTSTTQDYRFIDELKSAKFYRLKQIDFDETYEYSDIVEIHSAEEFRVYYSNETSQLNIRSQKAVDQTAQLTVYNIHGKLILDQTLIIDGSFNAVPLHLRDDQLFIAVLMLENSMHRFKIML